MCNFSKSGYWWLPSAPEKQIAGTLTFGDAQRAELRLLGSFREPREIFEAMGTWGKGYNPDIILGATEGGGKYTLYNCISFGFQMSSVTITTFSPQIVIEGKHFSNSENIIFSDMSICLSHMDEWYTVTGRELKIENPTTDKAKTTFIYQKPDKLLAQFDGGHIGIGHDINYNFIRPSIDFRFYERACISICLDKPMHLHDFLEEWVSCVCYFVTLGVGRPLSILELRGKTVDDCKGENDSRETSTIVELYMNDNLYGDEDKEILRHDMVYIYPDISSNFEALFTNWVRTFREIRPVIETFFRKVMARGLFSTNSFLNTVQACEAYHRLQKEGDDPLEEHEIRVQAILESAPEEYKQWLRERLHYRKEKPLSRRLCEMLEEHENLTELSRKDCKGKAYRITEIRNAYNHLSGKKKADYVGFRDLYVFETLLQWILHAYMLEEMGISRARAHELIARNQDFQFFKSVYLKKQSVEILKIEQVKDAKTN